MSRTAKPVPHYVVTVGYRQYLLPQPAALKLAEIMSSAVEVETDLHRDYSLALKYVVRDAPQVELELVKPSRSSHAAERTSPPASLEVTPVRRRKPSGNGTSRHGESKGAPWGNPQCPPGTGNPSQPGVTHEPN